MGRAGGRSRMPMRNSEASFTVREKPGAASRRRASLRSCTAYSFMFEPQPAALTTTASKPCPAKASMVRPARCSAVFASPACEARAPQQTREAEASRMRQQAVQEQGTDHAVATVLRRRLRPRHLHHRSELDAGWAGRFASAAVEALIDVRLKARVVKRHQPERRLLDLPHPPARAIAFVVQAAKGRALR